MFTAYIFINVPHPVLKAFEEALLLLLQDVETFASLCLSELGVAPTAAPELQQLLSGVNS